MPAADESYKKAVPLAEQQLKLNPRDAGILASLAYYYSMLGDRKQALVFWIGPSTWSR